MMYKRAAIYSIINFAITMIVFYIEVVFGILPSLALYQVFIAIMASLLVGVITFLMSKRQLEFWELVEDNLGSQSVGDYLFGKLSRRNLIKILREEKE